METAKPPSTVVQEKLKKTLAAEVPFFYRLFLLVYMEQLPAEPRR